MMKDFSNMTPAEIQDFMTNASREEMNKRYDENRAKAKAFAEYQREMLKDLVNEERANNDVMIAAVRKSARAKLQNTSSYFERIAIMKACMNSESQIAASESKFKGEYDEICRVCGRIDAEIDAESVATHTDCIDVAPAPQKSRLESVALIAVCGVIALVLILAITGVIAIAR